MRGRFWVVACALLSLGPLLPAQADDDAPPVPVPVPGSCTVHPTQVVNPGCAPALTGAERTYPDLVPDVTFVFLWRPPVFDPVTGRTAPGPPELWFDTLSRNLGAVPFDVLADDPSDLAGSTVSQCVAWTAELVCRERAQVGGFTWHEPHRHYHFEDYAAYQLRRLLPDGEPDYSEAGLVAVSEKVSFCLLDSSRTRDDAQPAPRYPACTSTNQGISPGWADVYTFDLPGQRFPLTGVSDGTYALIVDMDTTNRIYETHDANNRVVVTVDLDVDMEEAAIVDREWL